MISENSEVEGNYTIKIPRKNIFLDLNNELIKRTIENSENYLDFVHLNNTKISVLSRKCRNFSKTVGLP